ncbi:PTS glucose transporter subunit IIA [Erysipelotrichaceae bacterium AF15-26LB]|nr:PTS glucose transporter subunit IIA [[Clostridium] innocuum]RJV87808.1 PTS glucose transporter subunit IIA [Erysipelotrichaceae bacterium AF15-26LB]RJV91316.1 PTS glucose transporter subunit IIA [Erysipelotrichaceae bacterium AF19-24AC]
MFKFFKKKMDENVYAPVNGTCIALEYVKDQVFASGMMGKGVAFQLDEDTIYAPCDGTLVMIADTRHAFGLQAENGLEILIHIGLDTVNLNGEGLLVLKEKGSMVKKGEPVIKIDMPFMKQHNIDLTTPMIVTNAQDMALTFSHIGDKVCKGEDIVISKEN